MKNRNKAQKVDLDMLWVGVKEVRPSRKRGGAMVTSENKLILRLGDPNLEKDAKLGRNVQSFLKKITVSS